MVKTKFKENETLWDSNFADVLSEEINNFWNQYNDNNEQSQYQIAKENHFKSVRKYSTEHSSVLYFFAFIGLIISFLLIVPFYWAYKKFQSLQQNKKQLQNEVDACKFELEKAKNQLIRSINVLPLIDKCFDIFQLEEQGPITKELIDKMNEESYFFNISCDENFNPYRTSWFIYDKNKIVIQYSHQEEVWSSKTYHGSITISHSRYINGEWQTEYETIYASYEHPYVEINNYEDKYYSFLKSCEQLEFKFIKTRKILNLFSNNKTDLENPIFNKLFKWEYNDPVQFRMIFTPHKQEIMNNEYFTHKKHLPTSDQLNKEFNFLYNNESAKSLHWLDLNYKDLIYKFINDANYSFEQYKDNVKILFENYFYSVYNGMKFLWTTPIIQSEDHTNIIKRSKTTNYLESTPHYVLNNVLNCDIIKLDTECFNFIQSNDVINIGAIELNKVIFIGTSYEAVKKVKYVYVSGHDVPVNYVDFIPESKYKTLYYKRINIPYSKTIDNQLLKYVNQNNIKYHIKNNFLVIEVDDDLNDAEILNYFSLIYKNITKK